MRRRVDFANACICLLVPLGVVVVQTYFSLPVEALVLIWTATVAAGICLPKWSGRLVGEAAAMQQCFDSAVFGIKFGNEDRDDALVASRAKRYYEHHGDGGDDQGLDGWYSVAIGDMKAGDAIARCQWQNTEWTKRQLRRSVLYGGLCFTPYRCHFDHASGRCLLKLSFLSTVAEWVVQRVAEGV